MTVAEKQWNMYSGNDESSPGSYGNQHYQAESPSDPGTMGKYQAAQPPMQPQVGYAPYGAMKSVKKMKHAYAAWQSQSASNQCPPVVCDPQYVIQDCYVTRMVPYIHPVVNVNRQIIVNVPQHFYRPVTKNVVVDPGCPTAQQPGPTYY